ncbi:MAG TPA: hypothetical protein VGX49_16450 [Jatrophihabitans sp.]|nr:hypothetical protein [Jatrophihabitans sp.]
MVDDRSVEVTAGESNDPCRPPGTSNVQLAPGAVTERVTLEPQAEAAAKQMRRAMVMARRSLLLDQDLGVEVPGSVVPLFGLVMCERMTDFAMITPYQVETWWRTGTSYTRLEQHPNSVPAE